MTMSRCLDACRWLFCAGTPAVAACLLVACTTTENPKAMPPLPTYMGPGYLHGTVGSLTRVRRADDRPLLISGYGLVAQLRHTGSTSVPQRLSQFYMTMLRKRGDRDPHFKSPRTVLSDDRFAAVKVEGLIPAGAMRGTRFDLLVTALEGTQTTSLEHGVLYTTELAIMGANPTGMFSRPQAEANGWIYVDPFSSQARKHGDQVLSALVIAGGRVTVDRQIKIILNRASYTRSGLIADRINERFPMEVVDRDPTANARNDTTIDLSIPRRFSRDPQRFLRLVNHLYLERTSGFEVRKAQQLGDLLLVHEGYAERISLAWQALGKRTLPVLRQYYRHAQWSVRFAAMEAGAVLDDERAADALATVAHSPDAGHRQRAAAILQHLPRSQTASRALYALLDDDQQSVRLAAYDSLSANGDAIVRRVPIGYRGKAKFLLDMVPAREPLIYVVQDEFPRIALFNIDTQVQAPSHARLWDNHFMIKASAPEAPVDVFFQPHGEQRGQTHQIAPTVANLILLMGHRPSAEQPHAGLDLSYGRVVNALYELTSQQTIPCRLVVRQTTLASAVAKFRGTAAIERPELAVPGSAPMPGVDDSSPLEDVPVPGPRPETSGSLEPEATVIDDDGDKGAS